MKHCLSGEALILHIIGGVDGSGMLCHVISLALSILPVVFLVELLEIIVSITISPTCLCKGLATPYCTPPLFIHIRGCVRKMGQCSARGLADKTDKEWPVQTIGVREGVEFQRLVWVGKEGGIFYTQRGRRREGEKNELNDEEKKGRG